MMQHTGEDYRIAAALINYFYPYLTNNDTKDILIARKIKERLTTPNRVLQIIKHKTLFKMNKIFQVDETFK